jgi:Ribbon-helix-helix protein, copG family
MKRPHKLTLMLSVEEYRALKRHAETQGLSFADILRQAIRTLPSSGLMSLMTPRN